MIKLYEPHMAPQILLSEAGLYGKGFFETMLMVDDHILLLEAHLERINKALVYFGVKGTLVEAHIEELMSKTISTPTPIPPKKTTVKLIAFVDKEDAYIHVLQTPYRYSNKDLTNPQGVEFIEQIRNGNALMNQFKSLNYFEHLHFLEKANQKSLFDLVQFNYEDYIIEGLKSNIFLYNGHHWLTPALDQGLLPGIARAWLIEKLVTLGYDVQETKIKKSELLQAGLVVATNSLIGCVVVQFQNTPIEHMQMKSVIDELGVAYRGGQYAANSPRSSGNN